MRTLLFIIVCVLASGCSRHVYENYEAKEKNIYNNETSIDSVWMKQYLQQVASHTTRRTDSVIIRDSVFIKEHADGSTETYKERNYERVGNYVTTEQLNELLVSIQGNTSIHRDTLLYQQRDTTYIYKEKELSRVQRFVNVLGMIGTGIMISILFAFIALRFRK